VAPLKNPDLHGNVPESCPVALVLIDVINDLAFAGGGALAGPATLMAKRLSTFKDRCRQAGIPAIYANDNYGRWRSDRDAQLRHCLEDGVPGEAVARRLQPRESDYYVVKPKHSGFYGTTLDVLLDYLGTELLILTGIATDSCVLFTANDAFLRDFRIIVPSDCVVSENEERQASALELMRRVLDVRVCESTAIDLDELLAPRPQRSQTSGNMVDADEGSGRVG
jgi:nicotinamidase-related amidase